MGYNQVHTHYPQPTNQVGGFNPSESQIGSSYQLLGKIKVMFQTTNQQQYWDHVIIFIKSKYSFLQFLPDRGYEMIQREAPKRSKRVDKEQLGEFQCVWGIQL